MSENGSDNGDGSENPDPESDTANVAHTFRSVVMEMEDPEDAQLDQQEMSVPGDGENSSQASADIVLLTAVQAVSDTDECSNMGSVTTSDVSLSEDAITDFYTLALGNVQNDAHALINVDDQPEDAGCRVVSPHVSICASDLELYEPECDQLTKCDDADGNIDVADQAMHERITHECIPGANMPELVPSERDHLRNSNCLHDDCNTCVSCNLRRQANSLIGPSSMNTCSDCADNLLANCHDGVESMRTETSTEPALILSISHRSRSESCEIVTQFDSYSGLTRQTVDNVGDQATVMENSSNVLYAMPHLQQYSNNHPSDVENGSEAITNTAFVDNSVCGNGYNDADTGDMHSDSDLPEDRTESNIDLVSEIERDSWRTESDQNTSIVQLNDSTGIECANITVVRSESTESTNVCSALESETEECGLLNETKYDRPGKERHASGSSPEADSGNAGSCLMETKYSPIELEPECNYPRNLVIDSVSVERDDASEVKHDEKTIKTELKNVNTSSCTYSNLVSSENISYDPNPSVFDHSALLTSRNNTAMNSDHAFHIASELVVQELRPDSPDITHTASDPYDAHPQVSEVCFTPEARDSIKDDLFIKKSLSCQHKEPIMCCENSNEELTVCEQASTDVNQHSICISQVVSRCDLTDDDDHHNDVELNHEHERTEDDLLNELDAELGTPEHLSESDPCHNLHSTSESPLQNHEQDEVSKNTSSCFTCKAISNVPDKLRHDTESTHSTHPTVVCFSSTHSSSESDNTSSGLATSHISIRELIDHPITSNLSSDSPDDNDVTNHLSPELPDSIIDSQPSNVLNVSNTNSDCIQEHVITLESSACLPVESQCTTQTGHSSIVQDNVDDHIDHSNVSTDVFSNGFSNGVSVEQSDRDDIGGGTVVPDHPDYELDLKQADYHKHSLDRLQSQNAVLKGRLETAIKERDQYLVRMYEVESRHRSGQHLLQIKELECTISQQEAELKGLKEKLSSHDVAAKRAVGTLQNELKLRVDQVTKMYETTAREKDSMVVKYAQAEQKKIEFQRQFEQADNRVKELSRDREQIIGKMRQLKAEQQRAVNELEHKNSDLGNALRELERHKELLSSAEVRIKWAQNKMKAELDGHKDTKVKLEKMNSKLKETKEECDQVRMDCQVMIKTYQESEEMKSSTLESELMLKKQEKTDQEEGYHMLRKELEFLKTKHKDDLEELNALRDKVKCMEAERQSRDDNTSRQQVIIEKQKEERYSQQKRLDSLQHIKDERDRSHDLIKAMDQDIVELKIMNKDQQMEIECCRQREEELLELTERLSGKNAQLQSENFTHQSKVSNLTANQQIINMSLQEMETRNKIQSDTLKEEKKQRNDEVDNLSQILAARLQLVEDLTRQVDDWKDEVKTLKRKQSCNIKDLSRQLLQARRRLETIESSGEKESLNSLGSRASSRESLNNPEQPTQNHSRQNSQNSQNESSPKDYPVITEQVEVDKQVLIERIVKLQRGHARKNEKLEFMDEHIQHLMDEIQKKNKLIQMYALREDTGVLSSDYMDRNKLSAVKQEVQAQLTRKSGIMSSLYSTHVNDDHMTIELSLEINRKLQAVLEDALLKNMTLKDNIDTLGEEIARLSQENRQLQLSLQKLNH